MRQAESDLLSYSSSDDEKGVHVMTQRDGTHRFCHNCRVHSVHKSPVPVKSPGSATMIRLTLVPPSMEVQTGWLDAVRGLISSDALGAGAGACAAVNRQLPTSSTVKNNGLAGMSSLRTYTRHLSVAEVLA